MDHACIKVHGKGDKERMVPLGKTAMRFLESYLRAVRPFVEKKRNVNSLFFNQCGRPFTSKNLNDMIQNRAKHSKCGIQYTPHTFRRSCATELIRGNANPYHVKDLLGHESIDTLKAYTKLTINDIRKTHKKCHPREKDE